MTIDKPLPTVIDGVNIDPNNEVFFIAADLVLKTDKNIYLTGKAGTGKTTFLKYIKKCCEIQKINYITLAPTGIASINCGGQTIHSFFKLAFSPYVPDDDRICDNDSVYDESDYHWAMTDGQYENYDSNCDYGDLSDFLGY